MSLALSVLSLSTFSWSCSSLVFVRLWSTAIPTVRQKPAERAQARISSRVKPAAVPDLASVLASARGHNRAELFERPREHSLALVFTLVSTHKLLLGLIKMNPDSELPVLVEMDVRDDVVVLYHC